jgi:hypothetical protein
MAPRVLSRVGPAAVPGGAPASLAGFRFGGAPVLKSSGIFSEPRGLGSGSEIFPRERRARAPLPAGAGVTHRVNG